MKFLRTLFLAALMPGLAVAQGNSTSTTSDSSNVADEVKQLREMMAEQQQAMADQQKTVANQQKQLAAQQQEIERLRQQVNGGQQAASAESADSASAPRLINASLNTPTSSAAANQPMSGPPAQYQDANDKESPLSFHIGGADFTPGGFMDFTSIFRTTNTGNLGTNFFAVPFNNTIQDHLTEERFTAQNSRISLKAHEKFGENDVTGYYEMDFLGNDAANTEVTSNSHTFRQRLYWVDLRRGKWEILAGQTWSWLTPNRVGLGANPSDIFYSQDIDFNYQVGLTWTRAPEVRFVYHPNDHWAFGAALENPEQFGGQGEVTFPSAFNAQLANEIDEATINSTPNLHPDVIVKAGYDTDFGGRHFHAEAAGLLSGFKVTDLPTVAGAGFVTHTTEGGGVEGAINYEILKNLHLVSNVFWSDGGGRYIFGMAPDLVVLPANAAGSVCGVTGEAASGCDVRISLVHSGSGIAGLEYQVTPQTMVFGYYGAMYAQRNFASDITSTAATKPFVGFGGPDSANNNNRDVQEATLGWIQTFWKNPQYGALQLITQSSYLTRSPWFVAAGAPKNAHLFMEWVDLRYVLP